MRLLAPSAAPVLRYSSSLNLQPFPSNTLPLLPLKDALLLDVHTVGTYVPGCNLLSTPYFRGFTIIGGICA